VHAAQLTACLRRVRDADQITTALVDCSTTYRALIAFRPWWHAQPCPVVALESTGVYGKPVDHVLREAIDVYGANSHAVRQRPGKKTDERDAAWIAERLAHGVITPRVVPPPEMRALRDLTRTRVALGQTRTQATNRVYKIVEDTNIKLASVVSDVLGKRARRMVAALVAGERDAATLSAMALGRVRQQMPPLAVALEGQCTAHHATLIAGALAWVDVLGRQMGAMDQQLHALLGPLAPHLEQLDSLPGVNEITARALIAEMGLERTRCGLASRLASGAGLSPGNNASAGKRRRGRTRQGNRYLRRVLVQGAWATRTTSTFLGRTLRRREARVGGKKAAGAVAHKRLVSIYHLFLEGTFYAQK
jgi:transposase